MESEASRKRFHSGELLAWPSRVWKSCWAGKRTFRMLHWQIFVLWRRGAFHLVDISEHFMSNPRLTNLFIFRVSGYVGTY